MEEIKTRIIENPLKNTIITYLPIDNKFYYKFQFEIDNKKPRLIEAVKLANSQASKEIPKIVSFASTTIAPYSNKYARTYLINLNNEYIFRVKFKKYKKLDIWNLYEFKIIKLGN